MALHNPFDPAHHVVQLVFNVTEIKPSVNNTLNFNYLANTMGIWTTRTQDHSYPGQLVPRTTRTQDSSYPRQLVPRTSRTQDNSYPRQLVPSTSRTQANSYPCYMICYDVIQDHTISSQIISYHTTMSYIMSYPILSYPIISHNPYQDRFQPSIKK